MVDLQDKLVNPQSHLTLYLRLMQFWGLWPYKSESKLATCAHFVYVRILLLCLLIISVQQLLQITIEPDLENISAVVDIATMTFSAFYRQLIFILYIKDFKSLTENLDLNFLPKNLPRRVNTDMRKWLSHSRLYSYTYLFLGALLITVWLLSRHIDNIKISQELEKMSPVFKGIGNMTLAEESRLFLGRKHQMKLKLPISCWYPFETESSPMFELAFLWETWLATSSGMIYIIGDMFLFMVIYLICGQLEILKTSFEDMKKNYNFKTINDFTTANNSKDEESSVLLHSRSRAKMNVEKDVAEEISKCIDFHNSISMLICDLDSLLRSMVLVDFLHAVISLSFAMLLTVISNSVHEWIQMTIFIGVSVLHQFLNNFFGEILTHQQESVAEAAYGTPWVEGPKCLRGAVYMTVARARQPTRLSGWRMYILGLTTFVEFMRLLSSYFLVLQTLHAQESAENK